MAHDIFGERFHGFRQPAWHGLGTVFTDAQKSASEAFVDGGLDYEVAKCPIIINTPWGEINSQENANKVAIVRQPTSDDPIARQFAVVNADYGLLQNMDIARMFDPLTKEWGVETVGALGKGERIFLTLRVGSSEVKGDEVGEFFLINENKDGTGGINILYTTVRVVCQNTLSMALEGGGAVNLRHTSDVADRLQFETDVMAAMRKFRADSLQTIQKLAETPVTKKQAEEIIEAAYPLPKKPRAFRFADHNPDAIGKSLYMAERERADGAEAGWKWQAGRVEEFRNGAKSLLVKINDEFPRIAGTAWATVNAVTELADHRTGRDVDGKSKAMSATFGARAEEKDRAFRAAMAISLGETIKAPAKGRRKAAAV